MHGYSVHTARLVKKVCINAFSALAVHTGVRYASAVHTARLHGPCARVTLYVIYVTRAHGPCARPVRTGSAHRTSAAILISAYTMRGSIVPV